MEQLVLSAIAWLPKDIEAQLIRSCVVLIVAIIAYPLGSKIISSLVGHAVKTSNRYQKATDTDTEKRTKTLQNAFTTIWRFLVIFGVILYFATIFFSEKVVSSIFTSAGFLGVALAFGAQSLVKDFLAGIFIVSENQYRVGDTIEIDNFSGTVERIGARSTILRDVNGNVHYFPNGMITHVINKTMDFSNARLTISLDPESDLDAAIEVINKVGVQISEDEDWKEKIIEPPHYVMTGGISASAVDVVISGKVQPADQWSVTSEMRVRLLEAFEKHHINLSATTSTGPQIITTTKKRK